MSDNEPLSNATLEPEVSASKLTRRKFLKALAFGTGSLAAQGIVGTEAFSKINEILTLNYQPLMEKPEEGKLVEYSFGPKLKVKFLPLEHTSSETDSGIYLHPGGQETLDKYGDAIKNIVQSDGIDEVWVDAYPEELKHIADTLPPGLKDIAETKSAFEQKQPLIEFYQQIKDWVEERKNMGKTRIDIVCPDIIGGSPWALAISQRRPGPQLLIGVASLIGTGLFLAKANFDLSDVMKSYIHKGKLNRRDFLKTTLAVILSDVAFSSIAIPLRASIEKHGEQVINNSPVQNYVTEDTVRESWLVYALQSYNKFLGDDPKALPKTILFLHTPPHIEAMLMRLANPSEFQREINLYFSALPPEIWHNGVRRYSPDDTGNYYKVPFKLYP